jgi:hypothetical protein
MVVWLQCKNLFQNLLLKAVQAPEDNNSSLFEMPKKAWVGAVNLPEEYMKQLCQKFKCAQCRSNEHTLPYCPLMKNWIIKKKMQNKNNLEPDSQSQSVELLILFWPLLFLLFHFI